VIELRAERDEKRAEKQAEHNVDDDGVHHECIGIIVSPRTERTRDGRGNPAADCARRQHLHHHEAGKNECHSRERIDAESRYKPGFDQTGNRLRQHDQHIRPGHAQQRRDDGSLQQNTGARIQCGAPDIKTCRGRNRSIHERTLDLRMTRRSKGDCE